uniref:Uncharacterized protein n=1 Tax=Arundo donax TaxID=35708 RepID=A0A0A9AE54_ARUDO
MNFVQNFKMNVSKEWSWRSEVPILIVSSRI